MIGIKKLTETYIREKGKKRKEPDEPHRRKFVSLRQQFLVI